MLHSEKRLFHRKKLKTLAGKRLIHRNRPKINFRRKLPAELTPSRGLNSYSHLRKSQNEPIKYLVKSLLKYAAGLCLIAGALSFCSHRGPSNLPSTGQPYGNQGPAGAPGGAGQPPTGAPGSGQDNQGSGQHASYGPPSSGYSNRGSGSSYSNPGSGGDYSNNRDNEFLYNLTPNTITTVTCPFDQRINGYPFTLTAGAYPLGLQQSGLQLSEDFKDSHKIKSGDPPQRVRQLIDRSPYRRALARLGLHSESNINTPISSQGKHIANFFPRFDNVVTLNLLSQLKPVFTSRSLDRVNVNNSGLFQTSLPLLSAQLVAWAPALAQGSSGDPLLTLTYTLGRTNGPPIFSSNRKPYGRSYKIEFAEPYQANYIHNIHEENLQTNKIEGRWTCPRELRLMVHRSTSGPSSDFNKQYNYYRPRNSKIAQNISPEGFCQTGRNPTADEKYYFEREFGSYELHRLPFEIGNVIAWRGEEYINTRHPCIKFRKSSCYSPGFSRIEFDPEILNTGGNSCHGFHLLNESEIKDTSAGSKIYKLCPAYLSVCYRDIAR